MEPRSFKRGNVDWQERRPSLIRASMEPRSFKRGNILDAHNRSTGGWRLQWSHVHSNVETPAGSNERGCCMVASMEPRSFKRGNLEAVRKRHAAAMASMEPRSFKRGNLQELAAVFFKAIASMEPRSFKRGNSPHPKSACQSAYRSDCEWSPVNARHSIPSLHILQAFAFILHHFLHSSDPRLSPHRSTARFSLLHTITAILSDFSKSKARPIVSMLSRPRPSEGPRSINIT